MKDSQNQVSNVLTPVLCIQSMQIGGVMIRKGETYYVKDNSLNVKRLKVTIYNEEGNLYGEFPMACFNLKITPGIRRNISDNILLDQALTANQALFLIMTIADFEEQLSWDMKHAYLAVKHTYADYRKGRCGKYLATIEALYIK